MSRVIYVKSDTEKKTVLIGIITDEGEKQSFRIGESVYASLGRPIKGTELDPDSEEKLVSESRYRDAKRRALSILAYSDNSERSLIMKLRNKGVAPELAREVSREMVTLGYVDEQRQLERLVLEDADSKLFGEEKIIRHLATRGYAPGKIRAAISKLVEDGEIDFRKNAERLLLKKLEPDASREERLSLLRKWGYRSFR